MDKLFTFALLFFMLAMAIHRFWSTLFRINKKKGEIIQGWTLYALSIVHVSIGIITVVEYLAIHKIINYFISILGLSMFTLAWWGRTWAENTLGKYHSAQIEIRENHPLIVSGPYKYMRHPIYFFVIFEVLGFPLIANAYFAFFLSLLVYIPLLILRLFFEEQIHIKTFGPAYEKYKRTVPCLIPFTKRNKGKFADLLTSEGN